jgi:hypothetical protein
MINSVRFILHQQFVVAPPGWRPTQNIMQGFSGSLSDKLQKRKAIALAGYLLAAIAKPLIGLSIVWQGVSGARVFDRRLPFLQQLKTLGRKLGHHLPGLGEAIPAGSPSAITSSDTRSGNAAGCVGKLGAGGEVNFLLTTPNPRRPNEGI